jgi:hypothetical protein
MSPKEHPAMLAPLDIFKMQDGTYVWKAVAERFERAKVKAKELGPGTYMIFSQTTSNKTILTLDDSAERQATVNS